MSRVGRMPIKVPAGVKVKINDNEVVVSGPKGELSRNFNADMAIKLDDETVTSLKEIESLCRRMRGILQSS